MQIGIISLFPEMFDVIQKYGITKRAIKEEFLTIRYWNPRDFSEKQNRKIDDRPYGGGPGMLMMVNPLKKVIQEAKRYIGMKTKVIYLSPQGRKLDQKGVRELSNYSDMILVCGRYAGIDERLVDLEVDEEWSVGDYIISGGELAAMILIDSVSRVLPGVLKHADSIKNNSFSDGLLHYPNYTRPNIFSGARVPKILLSGKHEEIRKWRLKQSLGRTWLRRPDLLNSYPLNEEHLKLLDEFQKEYFSHD